MPDNDLIFRVRNPQIEKLRLEDYDDDISDTEKRRRITTILKSFNFGVNATPVHKNNVKATAGSLRAIRADIRHQGTVMIMANYDGTDNTGGISEGQSVCFDSVTGYACTGINDKWGTDEYVIIGIALKSISTALDEGDDLPLIPVKLQSVPLKEPEIKFGKATENWRKVKDYVGLDSVVINELLPDGTTLDEEITVYFLSSNSLSFSASCANVIKGQIISYTLCKSGTDFITSVPTGSINVCLSPETYDLLIGSIILGTRDSFRKQGWVEMDGESNSEDNGGSGIDMNRRFPRGFGSGIDTVEDEEGGNEDETHTHKYLGIGNPDEHPETYAESQDGHEVATLPPTSGWNVAAYGHTHDLPRIETVSHVPRYRKLIFYERLDNSEDS